MIARRRPGRIFNRRGKLLLPLATDPWWKRLWGRICGHQVWHQTGYILSDGDEHTFHPVSRIDSTPYTDAAERGSQIPTIADLWTCDCPPIVDEVYSNGLFGVPASRIPYAADIVGIAHTNDCLRARGLLLDGNTP